MSGRHDVEGWGETRVWRIIGVPVRRIEGDKAGGDERQIQHARVSRESS